MHAISLYRLVFLYSAFCDGHYSPFSSQFRAQSLPQVSSLFLLPLISVPCLSHSLHFTINYLMMTHSLVLDALSCPYTCSRVTVVFFFFFMWKCGRFLCTCSITLRLAHLSSRSVSHVFYLYVLGYTLFVFHLCYIAMFNLPFSYLSCRCFFSAFSVHSICLGAVPHVLCLFSAIAAALAAAEAAATTTAAAAAACRAVGWGRPKGK